MLRRAFSDNAHAGGSVYFRRKPFTPTKSALAFREDLASIFEAWGTQGSEDFDGTPRMRKGFRFSALSDEGFG